MGLSAANDPETTVEVDMELSSSEDQPREGGAISRGPHRLKTLSNFSANAEVSDPFNHPQLKIKAAAFPTECDSRERELENPGHKWPSLYYLILGYREIIQRQTCMQHTNMWW